jgi:hypothetical protein
VVCGIELEYLFKPRRYPFRPYRGTLSP